MTVSPEQMKVMTLFAVGLSKMAAAASREEGVELNPAENYALVVTIQLLSNASRKDQNDENPSGDGSVNGRNQES